MPLPTRPPLSRAPLALAAVASASLAACLGAAPGGRRQGPSQAPTLVVVALSGRDSVALFDARTLDRVATLPVGRTPHEVAASPDGRRAYVADAGDTSVTVVEGGAAPRVAATWPLPDSVRVHDVAASADGRVVWAVDATRRVILELDAASGRVRRRLPISRAGGWMLEAGGPGGALVVANLEGGAVTLVDPATGGERVLEAREGEIDAAPTRDGRELWSVNPRDGALTVWDAASGRALARLPVGRAPGRVAFTADGRHAVVVLSGDSAVAVYDVRTRERVASVVVPAGPKVVALSGRRAYLTHPGRGALTLVDLAAAAVVRTVPVPGAPDGVAVLEPRR